MLALISSTEQEDKCDKCDKKRRGGIVLLKGVCIDAVEQRAESNIKADTRRYLYSFCFQVPRPPPDQHRDGDNGRIVRSVQKFVGSRKV